MIVSNDLIIKSFDYQINPYPKKSLIVSLVFRVFQSESVFSPQYLLLTSSEGTGKYQFFPLTSRVPTVGEGCFSGDPHVTSLRSRRGYCFLSTSLWLSVGRIHTWRFNPFFTWTIHPTLRFPYVLDTHPPSALLGLTGIRGTPSVTDTEISNHGLTHWFLSSDLQSGIPRVWRQCGPNVCVVSWHIYLCRVCHKVVEPIWTVTLFVIWMGTTIVWLGDWNQGRVLHKLLWSWHRGVSVNIGQ